MPIPPEKLKLARSLLAGGPITQEALQRELQSSGKGESVLGRALLQSGFPTEEQLASLLQRVRIPKINARSTKIPLETIRLIPEAAAREHRVLALDRIGNILVVVTPNFAEPERLAEVRKQTGMLVTPIQCAADGFDAIVDDYYKRLAASGLTSAEPVGAAPTGGGSSASSNGAVQAIPMGSPDEDSFFRRFMSAGPLPAAESAM